MPAKNRPDSTWEDCDELRKYILRQKDFIYYRAYRQSRMLRLLPAGVIGAGSGASERRWNATDNELLIEGDGGAVRRMRPDENMVFQGRTSQKEVLPMLAIPVNPPPYSGEVRNASELRVFGMKRSGHHAVM